MSSGFYKIKEKLFKQFFLLQDYIAILSKKGIYALKFVFAFFASAYVIHLLIHVGFSDKWDFYSGNNFYKYIFYGLFLSRYIPEVLILKKRNSLRWIIDGILFTTGILIGYTLLKGNAAEEWASRIFGNFLLLNIYIIILIVAELHRLFRVVNSLRMSPASLFALSFLVLILAGSGLLMMPNARVEPISYLDALFTSASAVCVTGLVVVDTSAAFTDLGKIIILILIQVGGLGIMTFTGFFSYIFTGSASYKDRFLLKEMLSAETMSSLFKALIQIVVVTFLIELLGALLIYLNIGDVGQDPILFSVFHSVSAFCNAGFSTLPDGLGNTLVKDNYAVQSVISLLIILGGIGFPVLLALLKYTRYSLRRWTTVDKTKKIKWHMVTNHAGTRIVLISTFVLLIAGTLGYYLLEKNNSLEGMSGTGQFMVSFFGSVSARTAGFNVVDITKWSYPTIFLMIFLMWVGASPGSTGGGIKTTTFVVALKTVFDFIRGRKTVEIWNREIGTETIYRVLVVILLSVVVIFLGFFVLLVTDPYKNPVHLLFECFSAFGTVGLSIANTATLSGSGKITIIILMFLGRLGPLTVLTGLFVSGRKKYYRYPKQDLIIN